MKQKNDEIRVAVREAKDRRASARRGEENAVVSACTGRDMSTLGVMECLRWHKGRTGKCVSILGRCVDNGRLRTWLTRPDGQARHGRRMYASTEATQ